MRVLYRPLLSASLLCLAVLLPPAGNTAGRTGAEAMADAMTRMMDAMGFKGSGSDSGRSASSLGMPSMPSPFGMPGWPPGYGGFPGGFSGGFPGGFPSMPSTWTGSPLEGTWEAAGGGLLIVQGSNYRLYAPNGGFVDGTLRVSGDRVVLESSRADVSLEFDYALDQDRLALRDRSGQVYPYRRLVLDGGG
jgi:hypothetical protein